MLTVALPTRELDQQYAGRFNFLVLGNASDASRTRYFHSRNCTTNPPMDIMMIDVEIEISEYKLQMFVSRFSV